MRNSKKFTAMFLIFLSGFSGIQTINGITYSFTGSTPSVSTPTNTNIIVRSADRDDWDTLISPPGFSVNIDGVNYTKFIVSTNGWLALAPNSIGYPLPGYFSSALPSNSLSTYSGGLPFIAPLWDDDSCNIIQYGFSAGLLTVKWSVKWDKTFTGNFSTMFWITIDVNTGVITFNYEPGFYLQPPSVSASIGLAGFCNNMFYSVTPNAIIANSTISTTSEDSLVNFKPIDAQFIFTPVFTSLSWQGTIDTLYDNPGNWGNCSSPNCSVDAIIGITASGRMPTVSINQSVGDLIINSGASLRVQAGCTLSVCGDFVNYGTLIAEPGSVISFTGTQNHTIAGSLTGSNSFASLNIFKLSGTVTAVSDIDITQNFSTGSYSSIFDFSWRHLKVGGNFTNWNNTTTILPGSTLEFNGSINQVYTNTNGNDTLNNVTINKAGGKVFLIGTYGSMFIDSVLRLISGNIVTNPSLEVSVKWRSVSAIQSHSSNSFIDGRLRRALYLGSIDFPVGDSLVPNQGGLNGYELANVTFTSSTVVPNLLAWFDTWSSVSPIGPAGPDTCGPNTFSYDSLQLYDNGYWYFERSAASFNGAYNMTLYNTGGTNSAGAGNWTIATAPIAYNPNTASSWGLVATCDPSSTLQVNKRVQYNSPVSGASTSFNHIYSTAQGTVGSPVFIDDLEQNYSIKLSPNPVNNESQLIIHSNNPGRIKFEIRSITGQIIKRTYINLNAGEYRIPVTDYSAFLVPGIYSLTVEGEMFVRTIKMVVQ